MEGRESMPDSHRRGWTVGEVLRSAEELASKRPADLAPTRSEILDALGEVLELPRMDVLLAHERPMSEAERGRFRETLGRLLEGEPLAYVLGHEEFYGRRFQVDPRVLIPRPETEVLVERALERIPQGALVFEPCTGSGCVGISLTLERPDLRVLASDVSKEALAVCAQNARELGADRERLRLVHGSFWEAARGEAFDALVANPPYVDRDDDSLLAESVRRHEPALALYAEAGDPLSAYRALLAGGVRGLRPGAVVLLELGIDSADPVRELVQASAAYREPEILEDLSERPRILACERGA